MAEYELVREIQNLCRNNQKRDVSFEEIRCDDPVAYVRAMLPGEDVQLSADGDADAMTIHAVCGGLTQKFVFTRLD